MPIPSVSTYAFYFAQRANTQALTRQLAKANAELSGWKADAGLDLGAALAKSTALRNQITTLDAQISANKLIGKQLKVQQNILDNIRTNADAMMKTLISFSDGKIAAGTIREEAGNRLDALLSSLNTQDERRYLFGGSNTGEPPMKPYDGAPKAALDAAFQAKFGFTPDDPRAANIKPDELKAFLQNEFAAEFEDPKWGQNWSNADDVPRKARISDNETVDVAASANEQAMRKLAMAYSMLKQLGASKISAEALKTVVSEARNVVGSTNAQMVTIQSRIGVSQSRIDAVNELMTKSKDVATTALQDMEGTDPAEAKTRFDTLQTQLQMSYAQTANLMKLSILNYV